MFQRAGDYRAGGYAGKDALLVHQLPGHIEGIEAVDQQAVVQQADVQDGGDEAVLKAAQAGDEVVRFGGDGDYFDVAAVFLETAGVAHQRAAGAEAGHEHINVGQVGHDFLPGAGVMGFGVAFVAVLVQHQVVVGVLGDDFLRHRHAAVGAQGAVGVDNPGTVGFQQLGALCGHVFGHHHGDAVALEAADHRQRDAGVARGRLQDGAAGADFAVGFGALNHFEGNAVLDAAGGVLSLQLGVDPHLGVGADIAQFHQRRAADGSQQPSVWALGQHKRRLNRGKVGGDGGKRRAGVRRLATGNGQTAASGGARRRRRRRPAVRGLRRRRRTLRSQSAR